MAVQVEISPDGVTPEMLAARERLRARMGVSGTQTGGKGTVRRKIKKSTKLLGDDKRLQYALRSVGAAFIPGIEEVQMVKSDGRILFFNAPKVQAAPNANTYAVSGVCQDREISIPDILHQLAAAGIDISKVAKQEDATEGDSEVPKLVEVFDDNEAENA
ncbi:bifunctional Nascent polypeptide-associated complex NAC domain/NAC A-B domain superfamily/Transcription factor BTF3 [Babesia duncani]|uniref:Nascent polypeptide-associated complex subunit beta n=1 Tax=Babesia duncani TaxID=323732 RepID=A0AAD9PI76_9APIC|nr:bifunctional Nascent polypeptide-associated complex NAC domain/NAC A-B domain superfamily/Transcription factor BTF3 [Babesia duncani]